MFASFLAILVPNIQGTEVVDPPADWYAGDPHLHIQHCGGGPYGSASCGGTTHPTAPVFTGPSDPAINDILCEIAEDMDETNMSVGSVLIWAKPLAADFDLLRPLVDGSSISGFSTPDRILQYGVETSGLSCALYGHLIALRIGAPPPTETTDLFALSALDDCTNSTCNPDNLPNDGTLELAADAVQYFRDNNPKPVFGYAHQFWTKDLLAIPQVHNEQQGAVDWHMIDGRLTNVKCDLFINNPVLSIPEFKFQDFVGRPLALPIDVLLGRVDFLETVRLNLPFDQETLAWWYGAYYFLLNTGQRPSIVAGSDVKCHSAPIFREPRTYAHLGAGQTLTYDKWVNSIKEGRTSIANGWELFLDLKLGSSLEYSIGDEINLSTSGGGPVQLDFEATLSVASGANVPQYDPCSWTNDSACTVNDTLELVVNGEVVATYNPTGSPAGIDPAIIGGSHVFSSTLDITKSCWIAVRQASLSTHSAPIFVVLDGEPILECEDAEYWALYMDYLKWKLDLFDFTACCQTESKLRDDAEGSRVVFEYMRDYVFEGYPVGVNAHGEPVHSDRGPVVAGVELATSSKRNLFCFNAPRDESGTLYIGRELLTAPLGLGGAKLYVGNVVKEYSVSSDEAGFVKNRTSVPMNSYGYSLYYQYIWEVGSEVSGNWVSTKAIEVEGPLGVFE